MQAAKTDRIKGPNLPGSEAAFGCCDIDQKNVKMGCEGSRKSLGMAKYFELADQTRETPQFSSSKPLLKFRAPAHWPGHLEFAGIHDFGNERAIRARNSCLLRPWRDGVCWLRVLWLSSL